MPVVEPLTTLDTLTFAPFPPLAPELPAPPAPPKASASTMLRPVEEPALQALRTAGPPAPPENPAPIALPPLPPVTSACADASADPNVAAFAAEVAIPPAPPEPVPDVKIFPPNPPCDCANAVAGMPLELERVELASAMAVADPPAPELPDMASPPEPNGVDMF